MHAHPIFFVLHLQTKNDALLRGFYLGRKFYYFFLQIFFFATRDRIRLLRGYCIKNSRQSNIFIVFVVLRFYLRLRELMINRL